MYARVAKVVTTSLLMPACTAVQSQSSVQVIFQLGATRASFNDQVVAGDSINLEWGLAVSYKSIIEFGYTSIIDLADASMETDSRIQSEDGFFASGEMHYLRGSIPLTNRVSVFAIAGRSSFAVEATSTYGCLFFCGDLLTATTESNYLNEETGMALGVGMGFITKENRQLIVQYFDYNYGEEFDFTVFTLGHRWLLDIPI